jgi:hypothetical protein
MTVLKTKTAERLVGRSDFVELMTQAGKRPTGAMFAVRGRPTARWSLAEIEEVFQRQFTAEELDSAEEPDRRRQRIVAKYTESKRLAQLPARREKFGAWAQKKYGMTYDQAIATAAEQLEQTL